MSDLNADLPFVIFRPSTVEVELSSSSVESLHVVTLEESLNSIGRAFIDYCHENGFPFTPINHHVFNLYPDLGQIFAASCYPEICNLYQESVDPGFALFAHEVITNNSGKMAIVQLEDPFCNISAFYANLNPVKQGFRNLMKNTQNGNVPDPHYIHSPNDIEEHRKQLYLLGILLKLCETQ